jgi:dolichol-phosphate mannosyltransferase
MSDQLRTRNVHIQQHASPLQRRGLARGLAMALITPAETGTLDATHAAQADVRVSVVIPAHDEAENLPGLIAEIEAALAGVEHEVIVVDDGSHDHTGATLAAISQSTPALRMVRHARAGGQSAAVRSGLLVARGSIVVTLDGDGQNDPGYIPELLATLEAAGPSTGLAAGQRVGRKDGTAKTIASRFANSLRGALLRDGTRDSGCGLKAIRRHVFLLLPFFDGWHRFLPALVIREGYAVVHVDVIDRPRRFGRSKYGILDRGMRGALDLFGVWWLIRRSRRVEISSDTDV